LDKRGAGRRSKHCAQGHFPASEYSHGGFGDKEIPGSHRHVLAPMDRVCFNGWALQNVYDAPAQIVGARTGLGAERH
jgi:hypothetical protein